MRNRGMSSEEARLRGIGGFRGCLIALAILLPVYLVAGLIWCAL